MQRARGLAFPRSIGKGLPIRTHDNRFRYTGPVGTKPIEHLLDMRLHGVDHRWIFPRRPKGLAWGLFSRRLNRRCMGLSAVSKLTPGTGSQRSRRSRAGFRQRVGAPYKDMPARGYSAANGRKALSDQALSVAEGAGGFALLSSDF